MGKKIVQMDISELVKIPGSRGGRRAGAGRKGNGWELRRVALSLPPAMWKVIDQEKAHSTSESIRSLLGKVIPTEVKLTPIGNIPPINLRSTFYGMTPSGILDWIHQLILVTDFDRQEHGVSWETAINFIGTYYAKEEHRAVIHERLLSDFPQGCAIGPSKLEQVLNCTTTERKRWEKEGRLPVTHHIEGGTRRKPIRTPMYCRRTIESLNVEVIAQWRMDHEVKKSLNRREKEERSEVRSRYVLVESFQEGKRPYRIFGPVGVENGSIEDLWAQHKEKLPWDWEGTVMVQLRDFHTSEVIRMEMRVV